MKWIISIITMVLFISSVTALSSDCLGYWRFNDDLTDECSNSFDLTGTNNPPFVSSVSGTLDNAINFTHTETQYAETTDANLTVALPLVRSISFWFYIDDWDAGSRYLTTFSSGGSANRFYILRDVGGIDIGADGMTSSFEYIENCFLPENDRWYYFVLNIGTGGTDVYIDGSTTTNCSRSSTAVMDSGFNQLRIGGKYGADTETIDGKIDNFLITKTRFTATNITEGFNSGIGKDYVFLPSDLTPPTITVLSPINNSLIFTDVDINVSINETGVCDVDLDAFSLTSSNGTYFSFEETGLNNGDYTVTISCNDTALNNVESVLSFTKTSPFIFIYRPLNNSLIREDPVNITFAFNNFDPSNCTLYANTSDTGDYEQRQSIAIGSINITEEINITTLEVNLSDKHALFRFEEGTGTTAIDLITGNNGTISSASYDSSKLTNGTGNYSLNFSTSFVSVPFASWMSFGTDKDFSISAWIRDTLIDNQYHMIVDTRDVGSDGVFFTIATGDILQLAVDSTTFSSNTQIVDSEWHFVVATVDRDNAGNTDIWIDGIPESVGVTTSSQNVDTITPLFIGRRGFSAGTYWEGNLDEVIIWNKSLSQSEITTLYNQGVEFLNLTTVENVTTINQTLNQSQNITFLVPVENPETASKVEFFINCFNGFDINSSLYVTEWDADFTPPVITIEFPEDNLTHNLDMDINVSINEVGTCILNNTAFSLTSTNNTFFYFEETTLANDFYSIEVNCSDDSIVPNSDKQTISFTKDKEAPAIVSFFPTEDNLTFFPNTGSMELIFNTTDDRDLYNINVNITYQAQFLGTVVVYNDSINVSGNQYLYFKEIDTSMFPNATFTETIKVCDSHTKNELKIKAKEIKKEKDSIEFDFGSDKIKIKTKNSNSKKTDSSRKKDRYTVSFDFSSEESKPLFELSSNKGIDYLEDSQYSGHFIIGNHWVDFEPYNVNVMKTENGTYIIEVLESGRTFNFESIGELNCLTKTILFEIGTVPPFTIFGFQLDLDKASHVLLIFTFIILYIGMMLLGFFFKNFGFASFGFILGLVLGLFLSSIHIFMFLMFTFINIFIFIRYVVLMR